MDDLDRRLLNKWAAWDEDPRAKGAMQAMEAACSAVAARLGYTSTHLRAELSSCRREGLTRLEALRVVSLEVSLG